MPGPARPTRTLLFTGKGGVGKTTTAAATAVWAARRGHRSLVLSTDSAHSLADALDVPVPGHPTEVAERVWASQIDAQARFEQSWSEVQTYLVGFYRRVIALPGTLGRFSVTDARLEAGRLQVAFRLRDTALLPEIAGQDDAREGTG